MYLQGYIPLYLRGIAYNADYQGFKGEAFAFRGDEKNAELLLHLILEVTTVFRIQFTLLKIFENDNIIKFNIIATRRDL